MYKQGDSALLLRMILLKEPIKSFPKGVYNYGSIFQKIDTIKSRAKLL